MIREWEKWESLGKDNLSARLVDSYDGVTNPVRYKLRELISTIPIDERKILDVGCGPGIEYMAMEELLGQDFDYTGIDITPTQIEIAKERFPSEKYPNVKFSVGDIFSIPNSDIISNSYNIVNSKNVLEHLPTMQDNEVYNYENALVNLTKFDCKYLALGFHLGLCDETKINKHGFYRNCYGAEEVFTILNDNGITKIETYFIKTLHREKKAVLLWCRR